MLLWLYLMIGFNIFLAKHLQITESMLLCPQVVAFCAFSILFWSMAVRSSVEEVFTTGKINGERAQWACLLWLACQNRCGDSLV
ncbi:hypothetical protein BDU57DRAFT_518862 [Ampelomyces quisqualis]|uniref:Uncharacterized protein n=1 Tax=Ampelomyces quisqualis TaxID=50730 RepID=A0A6A5QNX6_AMPQU|nr:hypothetical protein BDU57DRAFT_518862 [Ampelomyces quisqualis]